jgi:ParB family chromosome partitioning protein
MRAIAGSVAWPYRGRGLSIIRRKTMADNISGSLSFIDIEDIHVGVNIRNIRTVFEEDRIKELAESIFEDGLINPLVVMDTEDPDTGDDIIELVCGARRLRAIQYILKHMDADWGDGEIKCTSFEGGVPEAELLNGTENIEQARIDDVDTSAWLFRMVEDSGYTQADLCKKLHKSPTWVSNRITFHRNACDDLRQAVREGIINFTAACQLAAKLSQDDQAKRVKKARQNNEKITLEEAERAGNADRTRRPGKKERETFQQMAERLAATDPIKYTNAHGVAMALRFVDGLLTGEEMEEVIKWDKPPKAPKVTDEDAQDVDGSDDDESDDSEE